MTPTVASPSLTSRQRQVLSFIARRTLASGIFPTIREIGVFLGTRHPNAIVCHLQSLLRKGYLVRGHDGTPHAYRLRGVRVVIDDGEAGQRLREAIDER